MYLPVVMTAQYRTVREGKRYYEDIEEAMKAAMNIKLSNGQMPAVLDENNLLHWNGDIKGRVKGRVNRKVKVASRKSKLPPEYYS